MGNHGSKSSLLSAECKQPGVKEQRVDGSSSSINLELVRCTLVAGKPVLGRKFIIVLGVRHLQIEWRCQEIIL